MCDITLISRTCCCVEVSHPLVDTNSNAYYYYYYYYIFCASPLTVQISPHMDVAPTCSPDHFASSFLRARVRIYETFSAVALVFLNSLYATICFAEYFVVIVCDFFFWFEYRKNCFRIHALYAYT